MLFNVIEQGDFGSEMLVLEWCTRESCFVAGFHARVPLLEPRNASEIKPSSNDSLSASSEGRGEAEQEENLPELAEMDGSWGMFVSELNMG